MKRSIITSILTVGIIFTGCKKEDKKEDVRPDLVIPSQYDGANFKANVVQEDSIAARLTALVNEAKKGRTNGTTVDKSNLDYLFTAGSPSLSSLITPYFKSRLEGANGWFNDLAQASGGTYIPGAPTGQGGTYGGYLFDENGLELEQLLEKGQFGATLYFIATQYLDNTNTLQKVDQVLNLFGAKPAFANSGSNNVTAENRDVFMANYAARRSDINDNNSLYIQIRNQFLKLQAAVKAGDAYNAERNQAAQEIKKLWEKINAATIINYCYSATSKLSGTNPTDSDKASALHSIGEAIGFIHGWRTIPQSNKIITDTQIDEILSLFNAPQSGTPSVYTFATDPVNQLPKLQQVITKLQSIYGFSSQDLDGFKNNWVQLQNR